VKIGDKKRNIMFKVTYYMLVFIKQYGHKENKSKEEKITE